MGPVVQGQLGDQSELEFRGTKRKVLGQNETLGWVRNRV